MAWLLLTAPGAVFLLLLLLLLLQILQTNKGLAGGLMLCVWQSAA
jgi:hypothetical protein